jgi:hypothetical protein
MRKSATFLRIAAFLTLLHAVLHTVGGVFGKPSPGPAAAAVLAMQTNRFLAMGHMRSFWDYYRGFGLSLTIFLTAEAIVFWQLAALAKSEAPRLRPILATFSIAYMALAVNSNTYFFLGPVMAEILIAACLVLAMVTAKSPPGLHAE